MKIYKNLNGDDCVIVENEDGTIWSGLKSAYEATLVSESAKELTESVTDDSKGNK
jgi:hypothetical protein